MVTAKEYVDKKLSPTIKARSDELERQIPREDAQITEGVKALLAINGGGIVAILGFIQALLNKSNVFTSFKYYGTHALLFFALGITAATLVPVFRAIYINSMLGHWKSQDRWEKCSYGCWFLSLIFFIVGVIYVGCGSQRGLQ